MSNPLTWGWKMKLSNNPITMNFEKAKWPPENTVLYNDGTNIQMIGCGGYSKMRKEEWDKTFEKVNKIKSPEIPFFAVSVKHL